MPLILNAPSSSSINLNQSRSLLQSIAQRVMLARGLAPTFSPSALAELDRIKGPASTSDKSVHDLRTLLWCSIDNDDSRDLDQLTSATLLTNGSTKLYVAIADVAAVLGQNSALDAHAKQNTTSIYTAAQVFPMLPEKLSTDLTSLNLLAERLAVIIEMVFSKEGGLTSSAIYPAKVRNQAMLAYNSVAAWLDGLAAEPPAVALVPGLGDNIRLQHKLATLLSELRHQHGALSLETIQTRPLFDGAILAGLEVDAPNSAKRLIEDVMIATNGVTARYLASKHLSSLRRVVRVPKAWPRIVELAATLGTTLPAGPDARALETFLVAARVADPEGFPDLSLTIIKLLGSGEYVLDVPGAEAAGHFGLAVKDYAHSTAPNRRFPDLITQRLLKAALAGSPPPYTNDALASLALHCTRQEDAAKKVERHIEKSAAAILLGPRVGEDFEATVSGVTDRGTWIRLQQPPVEGKLDAPPDGLRVGDHLRVKLLSTDVQRGFIDFIKVEQTDFPASHAFSALHPAAT